MFKMCNVWCYLLIGVLSFDLIKGTEFTINCKSIDSVKCTLINNPNVLDQEGTFNISCCVDVNVMRNIHFQQCQNLEDLKLTGTITEIEADAFKNLTKLKKLDLSTVNIININTLNFDNNQNLRLVNLRANEIKNIKVQNAKMLHTLILSTNNINELNETNFVGLSNIEEIDLAYNEILSIAKETFQNCATLKILNLNNNNLTNIEIGTFRTLNNLEKLRIAENHLMRIESKYFQLQGLKWLDLQNNNISEIEESAFKELPNLFSLILSENNISNLASSLLKYNTNLSIFNIAHNKIKDIPDELFTNNNNLNVVNFDFNSLTEFRVASPFNLHCVSLQHNEINAIDWSPEIQRQIVYLNLADNNLIDLNKESFNNLTNLRYLSLRNNKLKQFPLCIPANLGELDLSQNNLTSISLTNFCADNIERGGEKMLMTVDLRLNYITSFEVKNLGKWYPNIRTIDLRNNLLDQDLLELIKGITIFNKDLILFDGHLLREKSKYVQKKNKMSDIVFWAILAVPLVLIIAVICTIIIYKRRVRTNSNEITYDDAITLKKNNDVVTLRKNNDVMSNPMYYYPNLLPVYHDIEEQPTYLTILPNNSDSNDSEQRCLSRTSTGHYDVVH